MSDEKQQDARTSFVNTSKLIEKMRALKCLRPNEDDVLYVVSDGCAKQYKCANTLQTYIYLADRYGISIDVMVTAPYHGKSLVDAQAGLDKSMIKQKLIKELDNAIINEHGNHISQAEVCLAALSVDGRKHGDVTDTKHKKKEGKQKFDERHYDLSNYSNNNPIPL